MFSDEDFAGMEFPIHRVVNVDDISRLDKIFGLEVIIKDRNRIVKYLVYMYDAGSPFQAIRDIPHRKRLCAEQAGFDLSKDVRVLERLFNLEEPYPVIVTSLLREQNQALFTSIIIKEHLFYQVAEQLLTPVDKSKDMDSKTYIETLVKQQKLSEALEAYQAGLAKLYREASGGDAALAKTIPKALAITKTETVARQIMHRM